MHRGCLLQDLARRSALSLSESHSGLGSTVGPQCILEDEAAGLLPVGGLTGQM